MTTVTETQLDLPVFIKGKVRDVYGVGATMLLVVSSDRISAYDFVLPTAIPDKGKILNQLSCLWFEKTRDIVPNHLITSQIKQMPQLLHKHASVLDDRSMLVKKTQKLPIECVVRGYITGSGWEEYKKTGKVCGMALPEGLLESQKLPDPIFTPATKETGGKHDQNISLEEASKIVGEETAHALKALSLRLYRFGAEIAQAAGLILADTKFEFGFLDNQLIVIDEMLTPDSSRFWEASTYEIGKSQTSFDKQFVRDYLLSIRWNKQPPVPSLPEHVVQKTQAKYQEAYERLARVLSRYTGKNFTEVIF